MKKTYTNLKDQQDGVVSMIIVMLIMILLSLTVLAMSQNATREQRQAIDRQLSDQAYYNAESGINDTIKWLFANPGAPRQKIECDPKFVDVTFPLADPMPPLDNNLDTGGINKYTCILYNKNPETIEFDNLPVDDSKTVPIEAVGPDTGAAVPLKDLTISWDDANAKNTVSGCNFSTSSPPPLPTGLPSGMPGCNVGGVRIDLASPRVNRDETIRFMLNAFLLPHGVSTGAGTLDVPGNGGYPNNQGIIGQARCDGPQPAAVPPISRTCYVKIENLGYSPGTVGYLHLRSLYNQTDVSISGVDNNNKAVGFLNAQIMVDSTGRANDILRRVQVRVPSKPQYRQAEFGLQTKDSICKLYEVNINSVTSPTAPSDCN